MAGSVENMTVNPDGDLVLDAGCSEGSYLEVGDSGTIALHYIRIVLEVDENPHAVLDHVVSRQGVEAGDEADPAVAARDGGIVEPSRQPPFRIGYYSHFFP